MAVGRDSQVAVRRGLDALGAGVCVGGHGDVELFGTGGSAGGAVGHGVYLAVVGEDERAVGRARQETHRVRLEVGDALGFVGCVDGHRVDVECAAVALTQEIYGACDSVIHRVAVFAGTVREVGVGAGGGIVAPDVACHRRCVVLAPLVLEPFYIHVKHYVAVGREGY